ncbi:MAG: dTDP-4-dehydrorhamnose reductase [Cytophagales bacterium]|nr:MAG: dTDP-4-dehydrorhamnose reductase [Cytophagales bacterium]TAF61524.1 MAG: dTDP-4-dehydrorhamnose reductase [Cytophagales bacterium]
MSIWVTGSQGQLGQCLQELAPNHPHTFLWTNSSILPLTEENILSFIAQHQPKVCLHTSAYTAVDNAETEVYKAFLHNSYIPHLLARLCKQHQVRFIHCSTDFVFDGKGSQPLQENSPVAPLGIYGQSKARGESLILKSNPEACIVRTSWLYSLYGKNFFKTMHQLGQERPLLRVVYDQVGTPTYAPDLAEVLLKIATHPQTLSGIYHYSNEGVASWYDFATTIFHEFSLSAKLEPIRSEEYPTPAKRPAFSVLDKAKIRKALGIQIPHWQESVRLCVAKYMATKP